MAHKPPQRKGRPHRAIAASIAFRAATPQRRCGGLTTPSAAVRRSRPSTTTIRRYTAPAGPSPH
uniref:Uncharacterized protein n=1 Tax=Oryza meridionalis TaxID=40149 RepID=A0A0E0F2K2_9ORYZ